ncbi:calcium-binding protein [Methylopila sp. M107]|uniref:calcium-binding protein n=1 Tax=Methylopila sp. M107 TaxID=1101190 RepID=UPI00035CF85F|nr:calcium-binding protein [Methylopila sp. M107]
MAKKILNTNGQTVKLSAAQFEDYDVIRYSAELPDDLVRLALKGGGKLNLASELQDRDAYITASGKALQLKTGSGDDALFGGRRDDVFKSGSGDDTLTGGAGDDTLNGGSGDDSFVIFGSDSGVDTFRGGTGTDTLKLSGTVLLSRLTLDAAASVERIDTSAYSLTGTTGNDAFDISGVTSYANRTHIALREGNDSFIGSQAGDDVSGGAGNDTLSGGLGNDTLSGVEGDDLLNGDGGDDIFVVVGSQSGIDTFRGGEGTDTLSLKGDTELSRLTLDAAASVELINTNLHHLTGTTGDDVFDLSGVTGYSRTRQIDLREGDDSFIGSQGEDNVLGGAGDDTLNGGLGDDTLRG